MRIGYGYDAHRLVEGRPLILGGTEIPSPLGLLGHSDADVLTHAVIDALLGALAAGDIGTLFPDTDSKYKNISSILLLKKTAALMQERGFSLVNMDATIIAQKPRLEPFIEQMRQNISAALGTDINNVSVKATTEEGMGFTGNLSGISAHCVVLISRVSQP